MRSPLQASSMTRRSHSLVMWYYFTQLTLANSRPFPHTKCVPFSSFVPLFVRKEV